MELRTQISVQPPPLEWAVVAAFYSAVHYVNAYLWEVSRLDPKDHETREKAVQRDSQLRVVASHYSRLSNLGWQARYAPVFRIPGPELQVLLNVDLEQVRDVTLRALGVPP